MKKDIEALLSQHSFFGDMRPEYRRYIAGCGRNVHFEPDEYVARAGDPADAFYALRSGRVAVELFVPQRGSLTVQTLHAGEILGWSWLFEPHRWDVDARAVEPVSAVAFECECLRRKCDEDKEMGYDFMKRFARVFTARLEATRLQVLDVYGSEPAS